MIKSKESIISSPINKGKAFLFSKNIGTLIGLGYPAPTLENFNNSTQSYINSLEVFKNHLPEEQEIQDQPWKMVSLLGPEFCNYKLNNIFLAATQSIPTSEEDASRIFNCLQNQDIDLSRIYVQYYTVQFWKWIGSEIVLFPPDSTLLFLRIWLNTRDFTLLDKKVWKKLLSLPGWSDSQKKEIKNFELRYEFINKNSSCLAYIKEQESVLARKVPFCLKSQKEVQEQYMSQYRLLLKFTESFLKKILDIRRQDLDQQSKMIGAVDTSGGIPIQKISWLIQQMSGSAKKEKFSFELGSWEDRFLNSFKNISYKIFAWRVKKMLPAMQTFLKKAVNKLQKVNQELLPFQEIQRRFLEVLDESNAQYSPFKECIKQFDLRNIQLNELEKDISSFELLSQSLLTSVLGFLADN